MSTVCRFSPNNDQFVGAVLGRFRANSDIGGKSEERLLLAAIARRRAYYNREPRPYAGIDASKRSDLDSHLVDVVVQTDA